MRAQNTSSQGIDTFVGIEHLTAAYGDDTVLGSEAANWFWTFSGRDTLAGFGGNPSAGSSLIFGQGDRLTLNNAALNTLAAANITYSTVPAAPDSDHNAKRATFSGATKATTC